MCEQQSQSVLRPQMHSNSVSCFSSLTDQDGREDGGGNLFVFYLQKPTSQVYIFHQKSASVSSSSSSHSKRKEDGNLLMEV